MQFMHLIACLIALSLVTLKFAEGQDCVKAATFNAALLHQVNDYEEREEMIAAGLKANDADFYCIQEMWLESDMERLVEDTKDKYKYHYSPIHFKPNHIRKPTADMSWAEYFAVDAPCSFTGTGYFLYSIYYECGTKHGCDAKFGESSAAGAECLAQNCRNYLMSEHIHPHCLQCIILMFADVRSAIEACLPDAFEWWNRLNPSGLMLISKSEIKNPTYKTYHPSNTQAVERGYVEAEIEGKTVVCTHLSSVSPNYLEYDMPFSNYLDQQQNEIHKLLYEFTGTDHMLIGDLNTGPVVTGQTDEEKNLGGEFPESYDILMKGGYSAPYLSQDGRCTYCQNNPIVNYPNNVIDHILLHGSLNAATSTRIMDTTTPRPYSDHYGVKMNVCDAQ